jgi:hypothetical protein
MLTRLADLYYSSTTTSTQTRCKHCFRGELRGHRTDCSDRSTTTNNNNNQQEVDRQTARTQEICRQWDLNLRHVIQGQHAQAIAASDSGFGLTEQLYQDITHGTRSVSGIACDQLLELVQWCLSQDLEAGGTTWLACENSVSARAEHPIMTPGDETHWLVARGLWLVYDLTGEYRLDQEMRLRLREFNVRALRFVADLCYDAEVRAVTTAPQSSQRMWWRDSGDEVLDRLSNHRNSADQSIHDAALGALRDLAWRGFFRYDQADWTLD